MANSKSGQKGKPVKKAPVKQGKGERFPFAAIFWIVFFFVLAGLFLANREAISKNFNSLIHPTSSNKNVEPDAGPVAKGPTDSGGQKTPPAQAPVSKPETRPEQKPTPQEKPETPPAVKPPQPPAKPSSQPAAPQPPATQPPVDKKPPDKAPDKTPAVTPPVETRERGIYFIQVDNDGVLLRIKTTRSIPVSDSPMQDCLTALLAGPNAQEKRSGLISLIPSGARILSATVRGSTAYINFSEDFMYNTYGVEGYASQLKQIVWTATEFSNVKDVQFLVEGRRVDYLGEGIWIGSPLSRKSL